jgi:hypothetical protein
MQGKRSHALSRFASADDPDYKEIVNKMKVSLVFKSSILEGLDGYLLQKVAKSFLDDARDYDWRTPLHWAASTPNLRSTALLISKERKLVDAESRNGQTPLHRAIRYASKVQSLEKSVQDKFKATIEKVIQNSVIINTKDKDGKTAWDYADNGDDAAWVEELKTLQYRRHLNSGPSRLEQKEWDRSGKLSSDEKRALEALNSCLLEVYSGDETYLDLFTFLEPDVFNLLYNQKLESLFDTERPSIGRARCRWVHLPANNVRRKITARYIH